MEGWGLLFEVRYDFGWPGGGRNGQNYPTFIRTTLSGTAGMTNTNQNRWQVRYFVTTFWLFFCWDILVSARYEIGRKTFGVVRKWSKWSNLPQFHKGGTLSGAAGRKKN